MEHDWTEPLSDAIKVIHRAEPGPASLKMAGSVQNVIAARNFAQIGTAPIGSVVVLDPSLSRDLGGYRFDIALGQAPDGLLAIVSHAGQWTEPSLTAKRIAEDKGITLGTLKEGHDALSLAVEVHDLVMAGGRNDITALQQVCDLVDGCTESASIKTLLEDCSLQLGLTLRLSDRADGDATNPIRVQGMVRQYLTVDPSAAATGSVLVKNAVAYLARHIESLYQADYETNELPMATRSELLNEILLSDGATSADSISRLRQSGFPIDGSHHAVRVDCHDPLPTPVALHVLNRCQQRLAEILLDATTHTAGEWTRAGTMNSILLISSLERAHGDMTSSETERAVAAGLETASRLFPGLAVHVGVGTPHLGAEGLRASVTEATTAVRVARARGVTNQAQQFDRLGLGRALVRWAEIDGVRPVINEIMAPLLDQTPRQARQALSTLRAYLDCGQNVTRTAEVLHVHRNTARYRLERIAELLPVDMSDPDDRLLLELSCRVVDAELTSIGQVGILPETFHQPADR